MTDPLIKECGQVNMLEHVLAGRRENSGIFEIATFDDFLYLEIYNIILLSPKLVDR